MQSWSVCPPPPGALCTLSLGLPVPPTPDPVPRCVLPPEEVDGVCKDGDSGETGWTRCIGAPVADCGAGDELVLGAGAVGVLIRGAVAEEPLVLPPPPRCAIATLAAIAKKPVSTTVKASTRCIIDKTSTKRSSFPNSLIG